jgi:hypothetical protein
VLFRDVAGGELLRDSPAVGGDPALVVFEIRDEHPALELIVQLVADCGDGDAHGTFDGKLLAHVAPGGVLVNGDVAGQAP